MMNCSGIGERKFVRYLFGHAAGPVWAERGKIIAERDQEH